jgi:hypothetical protein
MRGADGQQGAVFSYVSPCYAEALSLARGWSALPWTAANVRERQERLRKPFSWKEPLRVFVNSMSDLFHGQVSDAFIARIFDVMVRTPHVYQCLTKRPERAATWPGPWTERDWRCTGPAEPGFYAEVYLMGDGEPSHSEKRPFGGGLPSAIHYTSWCDWKQVTWHNDTSNTDDPPGHREHVLPAPLLMIVYWMTGCLV